MKLNQGFRAPQSRFGRAGLRQGAATGPLLPYDPVVIFIGDSQALTQGDTTAADAWAAAYAADPAVKVADNTLAGAWVQYAPGQSATPTVGRTGLSYGANKNNVGPEAGFIAPFRAAYPGNTLHLINLSAPGSYMGRGPASGTLTGSVSGNVLTWTAGTAPSAGTLITGTGIPAGTYVASFGPGGNTRYIFNVGATGNPNVAATGSITITKYGYSYSITEGTLYHGSDGQINNGFKSRVTNALNTLTAAGKAPRVVAVVVMLGTNDMANGTAAGFFGAALTAFLAAIQADWPLTHAKIVLVEAKTGAAGSTTVRNAQTAAVTSKVLLMDTDGASFTLSDGTHYTQTGRQAIGSAAHTLATANLIPAVPGATGTLSAAALSSSTVQLTFTDASGATSHEYTINGGSSWLTLAGNKIVTGLTASTAYTFQVRGVNETGTGAASNSAGATTQAAASTLLTDNFTTDAGWSNLGWTNINVAGGVLDFAGVAQYYNTLRSLGFTPVVGKYYEVAFTLSGFTAGAVRPDIVGGTASSGTDRAANGTHTERLQAKTGNTGIQFLTTGAAPNTFKIDDLTIVGPYDTATVGGA